MIDRIKKIIVEKNLTLTSFASVTDIHPTTLSHIINGRETAGKGKVNQMPSTDVILKILTAFPDINAEWLIRGIGPMDKGRRPVIQPDLFHEPAVKPPQPPDTPKYRQEIEEKTEEKETKIPQKQTIIPELSISDNIDKIVIFFKNKIYVTLIPE
jgi:transcriptional regulator with XRE-family HTH domain